MEEILFLERFPWVRFETEWNTDINSFTVMVVIHTYTASLFLSLSPSLTLALFLISEHLMNYTFWEYIEVEITKLQASRCFQKASAFIHKGESIRTYGCQVDKDKLHT